MVDQIIPSLNTGSDYNKIKNVHDWICDHVTYSYLTAREEIGYEYRSAYNALADGTTVCNGYAQLFQKFMEKMGIESYFVSGVAPYTSSEHAWNLVKLDGQWYLVDVTYDDTSKGKNYNYFLVGAKQLKGTTSFGNIMIAPSRYKK